MKSLIKKLLHRYYLDRELSKKDKWGSLWNYQKGFLRETVEVGGITKENYHNFLSDRDYLKGHKYNGSFSSIIDNKLWLPLLLKEYKEHLPQYFYFKNREGFHHLKLFNSKYNDQVHNSEKVFSLLKEKDKLVFKHTHSSRGKGFMLFEYQYDRVLCNKKEISIEEFHRTVNALNSYIVTAFIYQNSYLNKIAPDSLNSVRFQFVRDEETGKNELIRCSQRFGRHGNVVDNSSSGMACLLYINAKTGIGKGDGLLNNNGYTYKKNIIHQDSKISFKDFEVLHFHSTKEKLLKISNSFPFLCYLGVDVAITEKGFKIIEINSLSGLRPMQEGGLLKNDLVKKVMRKKS